MKFSIKKTHLYGAIIILVLAIAVFFYFKPYFEKKAQKEPDKGKPDEISWMVDKNSYLYYPLNRGGMNFSRINYTDPDLPENSSIFVSKIIYESRSGYIYGFLVLPKVLNEQVPGIVLLPGAGVSKESELKLAERIAELGAAVLTIDQRGVGETSGSLNSIEQDYLDFANAKEPTQHLMVFDALRAYDLLYSAPFVDPDRIIMAGESLGGRIAIIAAAIDKNINGVLAISSSGVNVELTNNTKINAFLQSINSDHYIDQIAPRKLAIIHNLNDNIIPLSSAAYSYGLAQEPKRFVLVNDTGCNHGYCSSMYGGLAESLDFLVDIRSRTLFEIPDRPVNESRNLSAENQ